MPHIELNNSFPGILSLFQYRPQTAKPMSELAEILLRGPSSLPSEERELIATFVSRKNDCFFCTQSHAAAARAHFGSRQKIVDQCLEDHESAPITEKMKALLSVAWGVQRGGKNVTQQMIQRAKSAEATDMEIHDTILIAAAFCMYNRYVDGLSTTAPQDTNAYKEMGERLASVGYLSPQ